MTRDEHFERWMINILQSKCTPSQALREAPTSLTRGLFTRRRRLACKAPYHALPIARRHEGYIMLGVSYGNGLRIITCDAIANRPIATRPYRSRSA